ncbi:MAG TPA: VWA domain-containing protein [Terriglobia bacterium]|nr:VWA domain-containing protein [Terriglobia bacterium]
MIAQTKNVICPIARFVVASVMLLGALASASAVAQQIPGDINSTVIKPNVGSTAKPAADPDSANTLQQGLASIHVQSNLVVAPVTVIDRSGNFIQDLTQNDFHILDNGVPQRITEFQLATQPVALVIVVQTNMSVDPLLSQVRPVGSEFSGLLVGQKGVAAVITFADRVHVVQDFTNDPLALHAAMTHLVAAGGKARLNDALARAILMLSERPTAERRVIVVFSEGYDRGSETAKQEVVQAAADADVTIYGLKFDPTEVLLRRQDSPTVPNTLYDNDALPGVPGAPHTPETTRDYNSAPYLNPLDLIGKSVTAARSARPKAKSLLQQYAALSGGIAYNHWWRGGLENQIQRIALEVNSQYILAYAPNDLKQIGFHRLQVTVNEPKMNVRYRAGYFYGVTTKIPTKMPPKIKPKAQQKQS